MWCAGCALLSCPAWGLCVITTSALVHLIKGLPCTTVWACAHGTTLGDEAWLETRLGCCLFWPLLHEQIHACVPPHPSTALQGTTTLALSTSCLACCVRMRVWPPACWRPWGLTCRRSGPR